jgi:PadR family transcriptional regulator PadR
MEKQRDLLQGTLDMPILKAVSLGPLHGYGILLRIQQISKDQLDIQQGSLYLSVVPPRASGPDREGMGRV